MSGLTPAEVELKRLFRYGFRPADIRDADGEVEIVAFIRDYVGWREAVLVYSEHEARAYRVALVDAEDNPLYIDVDRAEVLIPLDDVVTVVHALLSLPAPPARLIVPASGRPTDDLDPTHAPRRTR